jgi:hypothetical protein
MRFEVSASQEAFRTIVAEHPSGKTQATKDTDRKPIVLARVRRYLATGEVGHASCIPVGIVRKEKPPARLGPRDRLYYRWYAKEHEGVIRSLRDLTAGRFQDGAVARVVAMGFWTRGHAPTRGIRQVVDEHQGERASVADARVRVSHRPQASARQRQLEGPAHGQSKLGSEDARENLSDSGSRGAALVSVIGSIVRGSGTSAMPSHRRLQPPAAGAIMSRRG